MVFSNSKRKKKKYIYILKKTKCWRRNGNFSFLPEVKVPLLNDNLLTYVINGDAFRGNSRREANFRSLHRMLFLSLRFFEVVNRQFRGPGLLIFSKSYTLIRNILGLSRTVMLYKPPRMFGERIVLSDVIGRSRLQSYKYNNDFRHTKMSFQSEFISIRYRNITFYHNERTETYTIFAIAAMITSPGRSSAHLKS